MKFTDRAIGAMRSEIRDQHELRDLRGNRPKGRPAGAFPPRNAPESAAKLEYQILSVFQKRNTVAPMHQDFGNTAQGLGQVFPSRLSRASVLASRWNGVE